MAGGDGGTHDSTVPAAPIASPAAERRAPHPPEYVHGLIPGPLRDLLLLYPYFYAGRGRALV
jgi:hypothetical protein